MVVRTQARMLVGVCLILLLGAAVPAVASAAAPATDSLAIVAGLDRGVVPGPATATAIDVAGVAVDSAGNRYIVDPVSDVVEKVTPSGTLSIIAGVAGHPGAPKAGPATQSELANPDAVAVDGSGNVYIADGFPPFEPGGPGNDVVEKVTPSGTLSIIAGRIGSSGAPTPGPATSSKLGDPSGLAVDGSGNVYIADSDDAVIEKVTPSGTLSIAAGRVDKSGAPTPGPAKNSDLGIPLGVAVDRSGDLYIADNDQYVVEKVTPSGTLSIVAGRIDHFGSPTPGKATSSALGELYGVATDSAGDVYIADSGNHVVEKVTPSGTLSVIAGTVGQFGPPTPGSATSSDIDNLNGVAADSSGDVYIADGGAAVVEKVTPSGTLSIDAGLVDHGAAPPTPGPATSSALDAPGGLAVEPSGNGGYIADTNNHVVERVTASGTLSVIAGTAGKSGAPTPGAATHTDLGDPTAVAVDASGNLYIADPTNHVVEKVTPSGTLSILAGTVGKAGTPTPGPATHTDLGVPVGVAVDSTGDVYIADGSEKVVEKVTPSGTLSIVFRSPSNPGSPPYQPPGPSSVTVDAAGNLYLSFDGTDVNGGDVVQKLTPSGSLSTIASAADYVGAVAIDGAGDVFIPEDYVVEKLTPSGTTSIVAGTGNPGPPTPGAATSSELDPAAVAVDSSGNLFIADAANNDIEQVFGVAENASPVPPSPSVDPTSTGVACSPTGLVLGNVTSCTATVTDTAASGATTPTGTVGFSVATAAGTSTTAGSCQLGPTTTIGTAACAVTFTPAGTGTDTVTAGYGGDATHATSSGHSGSITVSNSATTGGTSTGSAPSGGTSAGGTPSGSGHRPSGHVRVGHATVSGTTVRVPVTCSGHTVCHVKVTLSVRETLTRGKVTGVIAKTTTKKTVIVGSTKLTIAAGTTTTIKVTLNRTGKRLLARHGAFRTKLTVIQSGTAVGHSRTVRITPKPPKIGGPAPAKT